MPLKSGKSQVGKNIKELEHSYKKTGKIGTSKPKSKKAAHKQAIAIALNKAGKSKKLKESYDDAINSYLKKYLIEMDVRRDPREIDGVVDNPDITDDETVEDNTSPMDNNEDYEEECESAEQGCSCNECPACQANQNKKPGILTFYGLK